MSLYALQHGIRNWLTTENPAVATQCGARAPAGLSVYLNTYRGQLLDCLAESYPITRQWLGDSAFTAAAAEHIDRRPPSSWTLDAYPEGFAATLDALWPDDAEVAELAQIEAALTAAFVGADADPVDPAGLAAVDWDRAVLHLVPTCTLLPVVTNAPAIWAALAAEETPPAAAPLPTPAHLAVWRTGFAPAFRTLAPTETKALRMAAAGATFAAICARLAADHGEAAAADMAGHMLAQWLADGLVMAIDG